MVSVIEMLAKYEQLRPKTREHNAKFTLSLIELCLQQGQITKKLCNLETRERCLPRLLSFAAPASDYSAP